LSRSVCFARPSLKLGAVLLLTGTPMKNGKNSQLFPLLRAIDHPLGKNQREYEAKYCGGSMNSFGGRNVWTANGATNGAELNAQIGYALLRKTKDEVLKLPEQKRKIRQVTMAKVDQSKYAFFLKVSERSERALIDSSDLNPLQLILIPILTRFTRFALASLKMRTISLRSAHGAGTKNCSRAEEKRFGGWKQQGGSFDFGPTNQSQASLCLRES